MRMYLTAILVVVALVTATGLAGTITFQQGANGYSGASDASLNASAAGSGTPYNARNWGGEVNLLLQGAGPATTDTYTTGQYAVLLKFDDIFASGQSVSSAKLRLHSCAVLPAAYPGSDHIDIQLYAWSTEVWAGTGGWSGQTDEDASTGIYRNKHTTNTLNWGGGAGSFATRGVDTYSDSLGTIWVDRPASGWASDASTVKWWEIDVTDLVQKWQIGTVTNYGFALFSDTLSGLKFDSSNATDASLRPQLVVDFVPEPATLVLIGCGMAGLAARKEIRK